MQQPIRRIRGFRGGRILGDYSLRGKHFAETRQQSHGVHLGQIARRLVPPGSKLPCIFRRSEARLQLSGGIVVETEVGGREALFQNGHPGEQAHRPSFHLVGRNQQHFSIALKECPGNLAQHILGKGNGAILQRDVDRGPIQ